MIANYLKKKLSTDNKPLNKDPIRIFNTKIYSSNAINQDYFLYSTQANFEGYMIYTKDIQGQNAV